MAGKLDQSLEDIMKTNRAPRASGRRRTAVKAKTVNGATGGVTKKSSVKAGKTSKAAAAAIAAAPAISATGESKIVVSGLPADISEQQIKDYFSKAVGPVKKALLTYGPNGQSRGTATITFTKPDSASKAAQQLNGIKVDNRPMKIEVVLGAAQAPIVKAKTLSERIAQPKAGAKGANKAVAKAGSKAGANGVANGTAASNGRGRGRKPGRVARPKKSAADLDVEMETYFHAGGDAGGAAAAPVATDGDAMAVEAL